MAVALSGPLLRPQAWLLRQVGEISDAVAPAAVALDSPHTMQATVAAVLEACCLRSEDTCIVLDLNHHAIARVTKHVPNKAGYADGPRLITAVYDTYVWLCTPQMHEDRSVGVPTPEQLAGRHKFLEDNPSVIQQAKAAVRLWLAGSWLSDAQA